MDRFSWSDGQLGPSETLVTQRIGVRIYDGDTKTSFDYGSGILTTHRLIWRDYRDQRCVISVSLSQVVYVEEEAASFSKSAKIVIHLSAASPDKAPGPVTSSPHSHIKLSFKEGGQTEFFRCLSEELQRKRWEHEPATVMPLQPGQARKVRAGIVGIERGIQQKHKATDQSISRAFEDLSNLMQKAKEMVTLSKNISSKIKDKHGDITEDETVRFKSYLLSMGIPDPVTRETHGTGNNYYRELAKQLSTMLQEPLKECGGLMTLTDVYCRVNRARGMELLSPEDLVNACKLLEPMKLPVRFRTFDSGVMVVELLSHSEAEIIKQTKETVNEQTSITAEELSKLVGVSVVLSKERLLSTEKAGHICRDESVEGLRFYPNLFLTRGDS